MHSMEHRLFLPVISSRRLSSCGSTLWMCQRHSSSTRSIDGLRNARHDKKVNGKDGGGACSIPHRGASRRSVAAEVAGDAVVDVVAGRRVQAPAPLVRVVRRPRRRRLEDTAPRALEREGGKD